MQVFNKNKNVDVIYLLREIPYSITFKDSQMAVADFRINHNSIGCIHCANKRCMKLCDNEINIEYVSGFPYDKNDDVCPVNAISISSDNKVVIDNKKCINCGLCANRCPVGAIYYKNGFIVNHSIENLIELENNNESIVKQMDQIDKLLKIEKKGCLILENEKIMDDIYKKLSNLDSKFYEQISRNLLIGLNCKCSKRRIGDVYTRMDGLLEDKNKIIGALEVEFGKDTLDASRAILDDIATLNIRYKIGKEDNHPLVVCLQLPNARQGYWQVIKDIKNVEKIHIQTITIGALILLVWNISSFILGNVDYYIDYDSMTIRNSIEKQINRKINISDKYLGIFEPNK